MERRRIFGRFDVPGRTFLFDRASGAARAHPAYPGTMGLCGRRSGGVRASDVWVPGDKMLPRCAPGRWFSRAGLRLARNVPRHLQLTFPLTMNAATTRATRRRRPRSHPATAPPRNRAPASSGGRMRTRWSASSPLPRWSPPVEWSPCAAARPRRSSGVKFATTSTCGTRR